MKYLLLRLQESGSWNGILGSIMASYLLPWPWSLAACVAGVMAVLLKGGKAPADPEPPA